ncbi:MAG: type II secretion system F family protein [Candidatus Verstraetearchaeota archaeon]|nr:type II secretion system F family protein [Candidatus Verstraetearchaeota archaeon]
MKKLRLPGPFRKLAALLPSEVVDEKLLFLIAFLYSISTAKPPREELFRIAGESSEYDVFASYVKCIHLLGAKWKYGLSKACEIVSEQVRNRVFRDFLIRLAQILAVGEDLQSFLKSELHVITEEFVARYERILEAVKVLLGIYSTVMSASVFVVVNFLLLSMVWGAGDPKMLVSAFAGSVAALLALALASYIFLPKDPLLCSCKDSIPRYSLFKKVLPACVGGGVAAAVILHQLGFSQGLSLTAAGVALIFPGYLSKRVEKRTMRLNEHVPVFFRSLGRIMSTVPLVVYAVQAILRSEFSELTMPIRNFYKRVKGGVDKAVAWEFFVRECGSHLVQMCTRVFSKTLERGGDPLSVGETMSDIAAKLLELRKRREQIAKAFESTMYVLHVLTVIVAIFVMKLISMFSYFLSKIQMQSFLVLQPIPESYLQLTSLFLIVSLAAVNAFMVKVAHGGAIETLVFHLAVFFILSGGTVYVTEIAAEKIFGLFEIPELLIP